MLHNDENKIAVLPLGAHEYHGPHLPLETDWLIAEGIVNEVKKNIPHHLNVQFLDVEKIGYSIEHNHRGGTKTLSIHEAIKRWFEIGQKLFNEGTKKLVILNAHGGNSPLMTLVTTEFRAAFPMLAVATSWGRFGLPEGLISQAEKALDIHGGFIETSVMLALHPDKVDMKKAQDFKNKQEELCQNYTYLRAYGPHAFGWLMEDLNPQGAAGNAMKANADAGHKLIEHAAKGFITLLEDVHRFDVDCFK